MNKNIYNFIIEFLRIFIILFVGFYFGAAYMYFFKTWDGVSLLPTYPEVFEQIKASSAVVQQGMLLAFIVAAFIFAAIEVFVPLMQEKRTNE